MYVAQQLTLSADKEDLATMRGQVGPADGPCWQEGEMLGQMLQDIDGKNVTFEALDEDGDGKITVDEYEHVTVRCMHLLGVFIRFINFYKGPLETAGDQEWSAVFDKFKRSALAVCTLAMRLVMLSELSVVHTESAHSKQVYQ